MPLSERTPIDLAHREAWRSARFAMETSGARTSPSGRRTSLGTWVHYAEYVFRLPVLKGWSRHNALKLRLHKLDFSFANLPQAFDGYTILQISDPHLDNLPDLVAPARALIDGLTPNLIAMTGDVRGAIKGPHAPAVALLDEVMQALGPCKDRLAILGNHDPGAIVEDLEGLGFRVLLNETVEIEHEGARLRVTGLDDVHSFYTDAARAALGADPDRFSIALIHSAELADAASEAGYDLHLSGHTHGGQICLPGGRHIVSNLTRCKAFAKGPWHCGAMQGYTSNGLGVSGIVARFNCPGEMVLITLRRAG